MSDTIELADLVQRFRRLFDGSELGYGTYNNINEIHESGKRTGRPLTKWGTVPDELWSAHLAGTSGLGIVPIKADATCVFGALDIDSYLDFDPASIAVKAHQMGWPLNVCRSKSGGAHCYLFASEPVPAKLMQRRLQDIASRLGYGDSEVFPKQTMVLDKDKDLGNWINLPWHGGDAGNRYGFNDQGDALVLHQWLDRAESLKQPAEWFDAPLPAAPASAGLPDDAPPCLQHLVAQGVPEGTRANVLFNLGVFCRKAHADSWKDRVESMNRDFIRVPLNSHEVSSTLKSLDRKAYGYTCSREPLKQYCDKARCRTRKHGVTNPLPSIGSIARLNTVPPVWFVDVEGTRIQLDSTDELLNPRYFTRKCCEALKGVLLPVVKEETWRDYIRPVYENMIEIPAPVEASPAGNLTDLLEEFCTGRTQAQSKEEIVLGKPWTDGGRTYFRLKDLMRFLTQRREWDFKLGKVATMLHSMKGARYHGDVKVSGKATKLWSVDEFVRQAEPVPVPDSLDHEGGF